MRVRKAIAALSIASFAVMGTVVMAPAAQAGGYGCSGGLSWSGPVANGTVYDYFDGTNNCSVFVKSTYAGTLTYMDIQIENSSGTQGNRDPGYFSSYAGPSRVYGVGKCVREYVFEEDPDGLVITSQYTPWHSCG
ncbi:hypothetical protein GCM10010193_14660 [Kitasatospora atroaurantiaca]|uniref:Peptidase inhibitor family I36 n=2 Tax=Kitasatospora atroaurantiaca TaxID=285545 RepID=A0A561EIB8_9ACTN|nr:hypothetical protein FB465_0247 [Kitasatospora atroaurantiaca]